MVKSLLLGVLLALLVCLVSVAPLVFQEQRDETVQHSSVDTSHHQMKMTAMTVTSGLTCPVLSSIYTDQSVAVPGEVGPRS